MDRQLLQVLGMGLAVVLLVGGIALWQSLRAGSQKKDLEALAAKHGWTYAEQVDGAQWRLTGSFGATRFVAEAQRPRKDEAIGVSRPQRTQLRATVPEPGGVLVAPKGLDAGPLGGAEVVLSRVVGSAATELLKADTVAVDGAFAQSFDVRARDPEAAQRLLTPAVRAALLEQATRSSRHPPVVTWSGGELVLTVGEDLTRSEDIEAFVGVGRALVDTIR